MSWISASKLWQGATLVSKDGARKKILAVGQTKPERATVYNFEVADSHNYFAGESSVLVHNTSILGKDDAIPEGAMVGATGELMAAAPPEISPEQAQILIKEFKSHIEANYIVVAIEDSPMAKLAGGLQVTRALIDGVIGPVYDGIVDGSIEWSGAVPQHLSSFDAAVSELLDSKAHGNVANIISKQLGATKNDVPDAKGDGFLNLYTHLKGRDFSRIKSIINDNPSKHIVVISDNNLTTGIPSELTGDVFIGAGNTDSFSHGRIVNLTPEAVDLFGFLAEKGATFNVASHGNFDLASWGQIISIADGNRFITSATNLGGKWFDTSAIIDVPLIHSRLGSGLITLPADDGTSGAKFAPSLAEPSSADASVTAPMFGPPRHPGSRGPLEMPVDPDGRIFGGLGPMKLDRYGEGGGASKRIADRRAKREAELVEHGKWVERQKTALAANPRRTDLVGAAASNVSLHSTQAIATAANKIIKDEILPIWKRDMEQFKLQKGVDEVPPAKIPKGLPESTAVALHEGLSNIDDYLIGQVELLEIAGAKAFTRNDPIRTVMALAGLVHPQDYHGAIRVEASRQGYKIGTIDEADNGREFLMRYARGTLNYDAVPELVLGPHADIGHMDPVLIALRQLPPGEGPALFSAVAKVAAKTKFGKDWSNSPIATWWDTTLDFDQLQVGTLHGPENISRVIRNKLNIRPAIKHWSDAYNQERMSSYTKPDYLELDEALADWEKYQGLLANLEDGINVSRNALEYARNNAEQSAQGRRPAGRQILKTLSPETLRLHINAQLRIGGNGRLMFSNEAHGGYRKSRSAQ